MFHFLLLFLNPSLLLMMHPLAPCAVWWFSCFQLRRVLKPSLLYEPIVMHISKSKVFTRYLLVLERLIGIKGTTITFERCTCSCFSYWSSVQFSISLLLPSSLLYFLHTIWLFRADDIWPAPFHHPVCLHSIFSLVWAELTIMMGPTVIPISDWFSQTDTELLATLTLDRKWHAPHFLDFHISKSAKDLPPNGPGPVRKCKIVADLKSSVALGIISQVSDKTLWDYTNMTGSKQIKLKIKDLSVL